MVRARSIGSPSIGGKHDSQPIVIKVFESVGEPADLFDDQVDGFGAAVADAVSVEVGQDLGLPGAQRAAEAGNFGNWTGVEAVQDLDRDLVARGRGGVVDRPQLLITLPGDVDLLPWVAGIKAAADLGLLTLGEMLHTVAEEPADLIEGSCLWPRRPRVSCCTRRRTSSTTCVPNRTT